MADPRFFKVGGPFTLARLAEISGSLIGEGADPDTFFNSVAPLDEAGPEDVSFLDNKRYAEAFTKSRAGACVVEAEWASKAPNGMALLMSENPYLAFARVAQAFYPDERPEPGIATTAVIDPTARLGEDCRVDAGAVIGGNVEMGKRCRIGANAVIGDAVVLGDDCVVGSSASLSHCIVGCRVVIYPGARVGQDGFGFATDASGHTKVPQLGRVIIHDDVEIGANTTIDRGAGPDTVIGAGCMIDNLVQIGHNVQLGKGCVIVAQVGISGSTRIGDNVMIGGQGGISGHVDIGKGAQIAAKSGVRSNIPAGTQYGGIPAVPIRDWHRQVVTLAGLSKRKGK
ncbi:MAG: UDP-3-O-(3-hydroxymyristoyl)glucosamine N-acyltransferase [Alphaproteobacteria bacterium]